MKIDLAKEELALILSDLNEQFEMINAHADKIPQIEMDIFMRNIQKLYEKSISLNKLNQKNEVFAGTKETKPKEAVEIKKQETAVIENKAKTEVVEQPKAILPQPEKNETPVQQENKTRDVAKEAYTGELNLDIPKAIESSFDDILEDTTPETNLFSEIKVNQEITDLNKKLADARNTHSLVEKLQSGRIESLKSVIGINDKFYFINELFGGNAQKYEDVIYTLNNFKKLDDAMQYFSTLKYRFTWEEDSDAYQKLVNMLERKFDMSHA